MEPLGDPKAPLCQDGSADPAVLLERGIRLVRDQEGASLHPEARAPGPHDQGAVLVGEARHERAGLPARRPELDQRRLLPCSRLDHNRRLVVHRLDLEQARTGIAVLAPNGDGPAKKRSLPHGEAAGDLERAGAGRARVLGFLDLEPTPDHGVLRDAEAAGRHERAVAGGNSVLGVEDRERATDLHFAGWSNPEDRVLCAGDLEDGALLSRSCDDLELQLVVLPSDNYSAHSWNLERVPCHVLEAGFHHRNALRSPPWLWPHVAIFLIKQQLLKPFCRPCDILIGMLKLHRFALLQGRIGRADRPKRLQFLSSQERPHERERKELMQPLEDAHRPPVEPLGGFGGETCIAPALRLSRAVRALGTKLPGNVSDARLKVGGLQEAPGTRDLRRVPPLPGCFLLPCNVHFALGCHDEVELIT
mmetsp:Transcript_3388/g.8017  ORF Transcript_3388/g.8017 Transcript_3388/m.8017 type:complete len:419 (-) Transcript_3388:384-1640(-)